jgi:hypothetical protein
MSLAATHNLDRDGRLPSCVPRQLESTHPTGTLEQDPGGLGSRRRRYECAGDLETSRRRASPTADRWG